ncbi:hypothetical protein AURDEDRAFT_128974 [Auricularia subglabra TFB-10046 SS5]|nr:hypothetical protein AURDEDRAFT_128974 [Auricularia subglabra TFB-10046 SS5]
MVRKKGRLWVISLATVCHAVHAWVHPILLEHLPLDSRRKASALLQLTEDKNVDYFAPVRYVSYARPSRGMDLSKLLDYVAHADSFMLDIDTFKMFEEFPHFRPRLLSTVEILLVLRLMHMVPSHPPEVALVNLTHLRVCWINTSMLGQDIEWDNLLPTLPALTHLCLDVLPIPICTYTPNAQSLVPLLATKQLQRVAVRYFRRYGNAADRLNSDLWSLQDERICWTAPEQMDESSVVDMYLSEARGGVDPWLAGYPVYCPQDELPSMSSKDEELWEDDPAECQEDEE